MSLSEKVKTMKVRAHVLVTGWVQGVFFRTETQHEARTHHVNGWIRNLPDDRVEAIFEGEKEDVKELIKFCKRGPTAAKVTAVDVTWEAYSGKFNSFEIRY